MARQLRCPSRAACRAGKGRATWRKESFRTGTGLTWRVIVNKYVLIATGFAGSCSAEEVNGISGCPTPTASVYCLRHSLPRPALKPSTCRGHRGQAPYKGTAGSIYSSVLLHPNFSFLSAFRHLHTGHGLGGSSGQHLPTILEMEKRKRLPNLLSLHPFLGIFRFL